MLMEGSEFGASNIWFGEQYMLKVQYDGAGNGFLAQIRTSDIHLRFSEQDSVFERNC